ncbi:MAG: DNA gyrase inhibitor YacG [Bdellovibrio sp.]|nr:DNA gyrase inhibitor YacG [Bdellovibrio sp.]
MKKDWWVKCPTCGEKFKYHDSDYRPFCSERCQLIDLGHWLEGDYAIPSEGESGEEGENKIDEENGEE